MRYVTLLITTLVCLAAGPAQTQASSLAPLRAWGDATARALSDGRPSDRAVQRQIGRLIRVVAQPTEASRAELARTRAGLDRALAHLRLSDRQRYFFSLAYQGVLDRAGLLPSGVDSDRDGVADIASSDDDGDGVPDPADPSDRGWGVPDAFWLRRAGSPGYCVWASDTAPLIRSFAAAARWEQRAGLRGCSAPRVLVAHAATATRRLRFKASSAVLQGRDLTLHIDINRAATLNVALRQKRSITRKNVRVTKYRVVQRSYRHKVRSGDQTLRVRLSRKPRKEATRVRLTARVGHRVVVRNLVVAFPSAPVTGSQLVPSGLGVPNVAAPEDCQADSDGDGLANCTETRGFDFTYYAPAASCNGTLGAFACLAPRTERVVSNPYDANTDHDARTEPVILDDGTPALRTFALDDAAEWQLARTGGVSNPSAPDSDGDGLGDVEETFRWGTSPASPDSDADSGVAGSGAPPNTALFDGAEVAASPGRFPTSPTSSDSDGDGEGDLDEILDGTVDPNVAEIPQYDVALDPAAPGVFLGLRTSTEHTVALQTSTTTTDTKRKEDEKTTQHLVQHRAFIQGEIGIKGKIGIGQRRRADPPASTTNKDDGGLGGSIGIEGKITGGYEFTDAKTTTHTTRFTEESVRESQRTYSESFTASTDATGTLSASFVITNESPFEAITLRNLRVFAQFLCLPRDGEVGCASSSQITVVPNPLVPDAAALPDGVTLPAATSKRITLRADDVNASILRQIAANPTNLQFLPADADVFITGENRSLAETVGRSLPRSTAKLTVDDDDGNVTTTIIAAANGRDWGKPSAALSALVPIRDALAMAHVEFTTAPGPGGTEVLDTVNGKAATPLRDDGKSDGAWIAFGSAARPEATNFNDVEVGVASQINLAYVADRDGDGLFDREERLLGTSDEDPDSDDDGATAPCPTAADLAGDPSLEACPFAYAGSVYPSDLFEARAGWDVPVKQRDGRPGYHVLSNPQTCDGDRDGSPDGVACPQAQEPQGSPSEQARTTDPLLADSDSDDTRDTQDPEPTVRPARLVSRSFSPSELIGEGGATLRGDGSGWSLTSGSAEGRSVHTPPFNVCAPPGPDDVDPPECAAATGFYKVTWNVAAFDVHGPSPVRATFRITARKPGAAPGGRRDTLLEADLDDNEIPGGFPDDVWQKDLYFALDADAKDVVLSLSTPVDHAVATVGEVTIQRVGTVGDPANQATWLGGAFAGGDTAEQERFGGIAIPGWMLAPGATRDGREGVVLPGADSGFRIQTFGPDLRLPARWGVTDARFGLRVDDVSTDDEIASLGVNSGTAPAGPGGDRMIVGEANPDTGIDPTDTFDATLGRQPLAQAHVWRSDFAAVGQTTYFDVLLESWRDVQHLSLPVATSPAAGGDLVLDNVVLDPLGKPIADGAYLAAHPVDAAGTLTAFTGGTGVGGPDYLPPAVPWVGFGMAPMTPAVELFRDDGDGNPAGPLAPNASDGSVVLTGTCSDVADCQTSTRYRDHARTLLSYEVNPVYSQWIIQAARVDPFVCPYPEQSFAWDDVQFRSTSPPINWARTETEPRVRDLRSGIGTPTMFLLGQKQGLRGTGLPNAQISALDHRWTPCGLGDGSNPESFSGPNHRLQRMFLLTRARTPRDPALSTP